MTACVIPRNLWSQFDADNVFTVTNNTGWQSDHEHCQLVAFDLLTKHYMAPLMYAVNLEYVDSRKRPPLTVLSGSGLSLRYEIHF